MLPELADKVTLYEVLHRIDVDLSEQARAAGCPCGGPLHRASWVRKPRGGPELPKAYAVRLGLCCGDCRRRTLPRSTLFFGRRVYWGVVVVVVMGLRQGGGQWGMRRLQRLLGMSLSTLRRWAAWFREVFPNSIRWKRLRGRLAGWLDPLRLPTALLERFSAHLDSEASVAACLRFLASNPPPGEHTR